MSGRKERRVAVVGAGVIGMATATAIAEAQLSDVRVTVFADRFTPDTTSDGAAGIWMPYLVGDNQRFYAEKTFELLKRLYITEHSSEIGINLVSGYLIGKQQEKDAYWKDIVFMCREMTDEERKLFGVDYGYAVTTFTTECTKFIPFLTKRFRALGGELIERKVNHLNELSDFDLVVNCSGVQAHHLVGDQLVKPIRGQILRVGAPWVKMFVLGDENYIIPLSGCVVLGGTHQEGDWRLSTNASDTKHILEGCYKLMPSLKKAVVLSEWAGLRPGRPAVRLERQLMHYPTKTVQVIHNYGHGGSGVTLFWGCALKVVEMVKQVLTETDAVTSHL